MRLRELKQKDGQITEEQTEEFYNDIDLEYLGQIILSKDSNSSLSGKVLKRIKSNRVYILLLRKGLFKEAIDVAYSRKDKEALLDIIEKSP